MKKNRVIESMTKFVLDGYYNFGYQYTMRVWRNEESLQNYYDKTDLTTFVNKTYKKYYADIAKMAELIGEFERVNAVEIINPNTGEGIVYYSNWP